MGVIDYTADPPMKTYRLRNCGNRFVAISTHDNVDLVVGLRLSSAWKMGLRPVPLTHGMWVRA